MEVRGEIRIAASTLANLNVEIEAKRAKTYSSTRNLAAGTLKLQDLDEVRRRKLEFRKRGNFPSGERAIRQISHVCMIHADDAVGGRRGRGGGGRFRSSCRLCN